MLHMRHDASCVVSAVMHIQGSVGVWESANIEVGCRCVQSSLSASSSSKDRASPEDRSC